SLVISLQTTGAGNMTITLPRTLVDAKTGGVDDQFFVLEDGANIDFQESKTNADRTLLISFPDGTEKIEIIGTQVVPEFGSLAVIIITVAIIGAIVISTRFGLTHKV
ncbi:MAG: PEFG-CTERM sorting domain-containing protein, partial [Nitrosotalea sp.]